MKDQFTVRVTSEIAAGSYYNSIHDCPLARALQNKFPDNYVVVGGKTADVGDKEYYISSNWTAETAKVLINGGIDSIDVTLTLRRRIIK